MRYIDKTPYKAQGDQLVDDYLSVTKDAEGHYINIDYPTFRKQLPSSTLFHRVKGRSVLTIIVRLQVYQKPR